jgi:Kef-type K+ transport system membrane component KefB
VGAFVWISSPEALKQHIAEEDSMGETFQVAAIWFGLAILSTIVASRLRISMALVEICVGVAAGAIASRFFSPGAMGADLPWLRFVASAGAVLLTFLAGTELDPTALRLKWKEVLSVGFVGFLAPFLGCAALARFALGWSPAASLLAGVALSTTSMAVVYAVMLESGFNKTEFGKGILGACFVNDLGTVIALGLLFSPFTYRTFVFVGIAAIACFLLPFLTARLTARYGNKTAAVRTKWVLFVLFALGGLAVWAGSEAVLPAYIAGMVLARTLSKDQSFIRRLRTLTIGFLTPFYFIRAGSLVSLPALLAVPAVFLVLLLGKVVSKILGLHPIIRVFRRDRKERWYYTLLMSTGLTFGTISALYGLSHGIVSPEQYSYLVAVVIGSALIPTLVANAFFMPRHLLSAKPDAAEGGLPEEPIESGKQAAE